MELIEKLKKQLSEEYGIHSDQELMVPIFCVINYK